jgi:UDP-N-acetylglucosamine--N-acetylmuramyl-(pentapeptide) pyrophosphoryl-undecaprenol N-acetylglucosamine transferase
MKEGSVMIIGGGTGGHISPGIALYEEFTANNIRPIFLTTKKDSKYSSFEVLKKDSLFWYRAPAFTKNPFKLPFFLIKFFFAIVKALMLLKKQRVRAVIGMGGYASAPALIAAKLKGVSYFLCEQNSVPGKVTRMFEKNARNIFGTFEVSEKFLKNKNAFMYTGNPLRQNSTQNISKIEARKFFHLENTKKVLLVIGGSQGALRLNELIFSLKEKHSQDFQNVGIIWSTGDKSYIEYKEKLGKSINGGTVYLSPYIEKVGLAYKSCDLAISRSGAGVMMELAANAIPSILIPYPFAADNHQDLNADSFVDAGASIKIKDMDATADKMSPILFDLLGNNGLLEKMSESALKAAKFDAALKIVRKVEQSAAL